MNYMVFGTKHLKKGPKLHDIHSISIALSFLFISILPNQGPSTPNAPCLGQSSYRAPDNASAKSILFLNFENNIGGRWDGALSSEYRMVIEHVKNQRFNTSTGCLHFHPLPNHNSGSIVYDFTENGIEPISVTPSTSVAWCWKASHVMQSNGIWLNLLIKDRRNNSNDQVGFSNWVKYTNIAFRTYFDPPNTWIFHDERIYDYAWNTFGPFEKGEITIQGIELLISFGKGAEGWLDNLWIGNGDPPSNINVVVPRKNTVEIPSKLTNFSYGFLDNNDFPDRVDLFRDRVEIYLNPGKGKEKKQSKGKNVKYIKRKPSMLFPLDPQRGPGSVTIADLNNDGLNDILLHFDDHQGNIVYINDYVKRRFLRAKTTISMASKNDRPYGSAVADIDCDGDLDLFQFSPFSRGGNFFGVHLFENKNYMLFSDCTDRARILPKAAFAAAFSDVNLDGYPDIFVPYRPYQKTAGQALPTPYIYINNKDGSFYPSPDKLAIRGTSFMEGAVFADFDNDGDNDLYIAVSEKIRSIGNHVVKRMPPENLLLLNDGTGSFTDYTEQSGTQCPFPSQCALAEDFDNDGDIDIFVINGATTSDRPIRSILYRNRGDATFECDSTSSEFILSEPGGGGAAVDYDNDGDLDIAVLCRGKEKPIQMENLTNNDSFVKVRVWGTKNNMSGIGAKVYCYEAGHVNEKKHLVGYREIFSSRGFQQFSPPTAHFGLGELGLVDIKVVFPPVNQANGVEILRKGVTKGSCIDISEAKGAVEKVVKSPYAWKEWKSFEYGFYSIPLWLVMIVSFIHIAVVTSITVDRPGSSNSDAIALTVFSIGIVLIAASVARSYKAGIPTSAAAFIIFLKRSHLKFLLRSVFYSKTWREKMMDVLFDELSRAIHTEGNYSFAREITRTGDDNITRQKQTSTADNLKTSIKNLERLVSLMKICTPLDIKWKQAREELRNISKISKSMADEIDKESVELFEIELKHSFQRLNSLLADYRMSLRKRYSVNFAAEWNRTVKEFRSKLKEAGIRLEEELQRGVDSVMVHLTQAEFNHIFGNLFTNSIWALSSSNEKIIKVKVQYDETSLILRWLDTGGGIEEDLRKRLFKENVTSSKPQGKGEGCFISGRIMKRRSGLIRADEPDKGYGASIFIKLIRTK